MIAPKKESQPARRKPCRKLWPIAVSGLVVIVVAAAIAIFVRNGDEAKENNSTPSKKGMITEATPAPVVPPVVIEKEPEPVVDPNARPTKPGEKVNGYVMLPSGRIHKPTGVVTNRVANYGKSKYSIFEKRSDNEIAGIVMMNPGDTIVGTKRYDRWFTQQFLESLKSPIEISEDDEPWQVELKQTVMQARLELKEAYDRGEDIDAIMAESRQQLQDLAKYKQQIKQLYTQNTKECETEEQLRDLQQAVNQMLEDKGCAPMDFTPLTKLNLMKEKTDE